jgi:uncharacterized lipoprotein YmbA
MKSLPRCVALLSAILMGGCLSKPHLERQSFTFAIPPAGENLSTSGPELGVRRIRVASPFDGQALTYRTGEFSYERDPYAELLGAPGEILMEPVGQYLRNSGAFRGVSGPNSVVTADIELEITVLQLYGDFRDRAHPAATLRMRFVASRTGDASHKALLQKEYTRNVPLHARAAEALVAGWNEALKQIMSDAAEDLKAAGQSKFQAPSVQAPEKFQLSTSKSEGERPGEPKINGG